ncbi:MAG: electron transfer flavoprotein subunit alpha/FixB family protein [Bacteroidetes bacterium]|nr:electron transfer flavoprotein subunit alpha/FixB family protein [Bacteroidota bacterium]
MVLVYIDQADGQIKKSSFEVACYGAALAQQLSTEACGIIIGNTSEDLSNFGNYGLKKVYSVKDASFNNLDPQMYIAAISGLAEKISANVIVLSNNTTGKAVAPGLSVKMKAGLVVGAVALPDLSNGFSVKKSVFSGKAFAHIKINTETKIISLNQNSYAVTKTDAKAEVEDYSANGGTPKIKVVKTDKVKGEIPLSEASIVVSGGRGLKGPENWGLITELAHLLGAATACSRPVADLGWRPHHEHVGQTGLAIAPNLYIAVGISGAIQHLAGVNRSKVIVVINKDPEAPFFKAADYGIVGDIFEVMPKIIDAVKNLKGL